MIRVKICRNKEKRILSFICEGHAGYARKPGDKDVVCAAVSAVIYTALGYMHEQFKMNDFTERDGFIEWNRPKVLEEGVSEKISVALEAMAIGIKQIERQYEKYVKIVDEEV